MLSSLRYLPSEAHEEAIASLYNRRPGDSVERQVTDPMRAVPPRPAEDVAPDAIRDAPDAEIPTTRTQESRSDASEGGLVSLVREAVLDDSVSSAMAPDGGAAPLSGVPVQMDSARGRFQVFEVSTAEEAPSAAPTGSPEGTNERAPQTDAAAAAPARDPEYLAEKRMPADGVISARQWTERASSSEPPPATDPPSSAASSAKRDLIGGAEAPPSAPIPREEESRFSPALTATAVAVAVASAARFVRPLTPRPSANHRRGERMGTRPISAENSNRGIACRFEKNQPVGPARPGGRRR